MPQLEISILLVVGAVCSILALYLGRPKEGKLKLPEHVDETDGEELPDPFDGVTTPEDLVDGDPLDAHSFWVKTRLLKLTLAFVLALALAVETITLGFCAVTADPPITTIHILRLLFSIYVLILALRSISQDNASEHSESLWHLTVLTFAAAALLFGAAIIPPNQNVVTSQEISLLSILLEWGALGLYIIAFLISSTIPQGPPLHFEPGGIYSQSIISSITNTARENVCGVIAASVWDTLLFSYTTKVVMLGHMSASLEIGDLPIVPANMRATTNFQSMKTALRIPINPLSIPLSSSRLFSFRRGSGWELLCKLVRLNKWVLIYEITLAAVSAVLWYTPTFFLQKLVKYIEDDELREDRRWGWVFVAGLLGFNIVCDLVTGQMWSIATTLVQVRFKIQLNSVLFAKTLVRKDIASSAASKADSNGDSNRKAATGNQTTAPESGNKESQTKNKSTEEEDDFSSKAQNMTLMTTDVDRVSEFAWHMFALVDSPIEIVIGTLFLYRLMGVSCFFGLAVTCLFLPLNHFAGKIMVKTQDNLMKARDERVALMNEVLGGIRMLKFMAWERSFEARILKIRDKELKLQKLNYIIETLWNAIWNGAPILVTLVSFWHFSVVRRQALTPSIAFTSITVFAEMKFALSALPETLVNMLQTLVSLRRIEKYLHGTETAFVPPLSQQNRDIAFQSATVTWPQDHSFLGSKTPSVSSTPKHKFSLVDLSLAFPAGELSLICGRLGSGKTLLLLALLGEVDLLAGQVLCPRSPPDALASFVEVKVSKEDWIMDGICAYVPQAAWLRNASIRDNILFNLPYDEDRYHKTLEVCALVSDLKILEDGDDSEIGERGVNLSGGQKARVSLRLSCLLTFASTILFLEEDYSTALETTLKMRLFEGIDSNLSDNFGNTIMHGLSAVTTLIIVSAVGGLPFMAVAILLGVLYYNAAKVYGQTSRDMRRLDSVTRSPIYSIYGETIAGVPIIRAFGASSKFLRDMLRCVDTNTNPYYWMWGVNRWLSVRFNIISGCIVGAIAFVAVASPAISASLAGFALAFASTITHDLLFVVRRFVGLEQSMVALERVKEYTDLVREPPEFMEPRPAPSWPEKGAIKCENLVIRYAPELPEVLHNLNFEINPGEKIGILGRTGSGKSTLALSFFRFVEATEGRILVDGLDIAQMGLTDLPTKLTIIPQDPTILSGTLRSTIDVFDEYQDAKIYEALRRVHLIPLEDTPEESASTVNINVFRNLDSPVSEGGENFSTGEKQLICMARAILKRSKVLVMDEATASVDYATDELISKTIRHEFANSTILTIAHRLRTVIDYDRVMLLDHGQIVEFDRPSTLLADTSTSFHALCRATGRREFSMLTKMAGV